MKKKRFLLSLLFPLLLTSCGQTYEKFYVPYNLDLITETQEIYSPTTISATNLRTFIDTKQNFCLYVYNDNCSHCSDSSELLKEYLSNNKIQIYKISIREYLLSKNEDDPLGPFEFLFGVTPNIFFFKEGNLSATLPRNKYTSGYNVFESTMNEILVNSYLFNANTLLGAEKFFENNQEYLIYLSNYSDHQEDSYISYSLKTYNEIVYPQMSKSDYSTLIVDVNNAEIELLDLLENTFNIDVENNSNIAMYKYRNTIINNDFEIGTIDYSTEEGKNNLKEIIETHLLKRSL